MKNDSFSRVLPFLLALIVAVSFIIGVLVVEVSAAPPVVTVWFPDGMGGWQSSDFSMSMGSEPVTFSYRDGQVFAECNGVVLLQGIFDAFPLLYGTNSVEPLSLSSDPSNPQLEQYTTFTLPFEQVLTNGGVVVLFSYTGSVDPPEPDRISIPVYTPNGVGGWDLQTTISALPNYPVNFNSNHTITQDGLNLGSWFGDYTYATLDTSILEKDSTSDLSSYVNSSTLTVPFEISFAYGASIILFNYAYVPPPPDTVDLKVYAPVGDSWTLIYDGPILKGEPYTFANGLVSSASGTLVSDSRLSGFTYITMDSDILKDPVKSEDLSKYINGEVPYEQAFNSDVTVVYFNTYHAPPASPVISIGSDFVVRWSAVPDAGRYRVYVNGQLATNPYPTYTSWDAYKYIDEIGTYSIYVVAVENVGGSSFDSEPSNTVTYVAAAPEITRFEIDSEDIFSKIRCNISGSGLAFLRGLGFEIAKKCNPDVWFDPETGEKFIFHLTRCDFAFDLINYKPEFLDKCIDHCRTQHTYADRIALLNGGTGLRYSYRLGDQKTLYLGSPRSEKLLRIYDKRLEYIDKKTKAYIKDNPYHNPDSWIRVEWQCRNEFAHGLFFSTDCDGNFFEKVQFMSVFRQIYERYCFSDMTSSYWNRQPAPFWHELFDWDVIPRIIENNNFV